MKIEFFRSNCTVFYYLFLWTHYKKSTYSKLRVVFNNVYRRILKLPPRSSASTMYAVYNIDSFENTIIKCINNLHRSNKLLRTFYYCSSDVKLELIKSYCSSFYCCYLWTSYKKSTFDRLRVAFNNAYRRVLSQPWRCSASAFYANIGINNFKTTIRKSIYGFTQRLAKSTKSFIVTIEKSWIVPIDI